MMVPDETLVFLEKLDRDIATLLQAADDAGEFLIAATLSHAREHVVARIAAIGNAPTSRAGS